MTTYATLRSCERDGKVSRVQQIVDWLGRDFDGVIVFDESHAMQNAAGYKSERGDKGPSQQGRAGLRLQHALPNARVLYGSLCNEDRLGEAFGPLVDAAELAEIRGLDEVHLYPSISVRTVGGAA